jgi:hypothetical protein
MAIAQVGERWQAISAVGAIVAATATAIYRPPPIGDRESFIALATLLSSVAGGLIYVMMRRFSMRRHLVAWALAAAAGIGGAVWCHSYYGALWDTRVAVYQGQSFVTGDEYTPIGTAWVAKQSDNPTDVLFAFAGAVSNVWTTESVERVKMRMRLTYYAVFPLVAVAILSTVQAVYIAGGFKGRGGK